MIYNIDKEYLIDTFRTIVNTPSPVGFHVLLNPVLERYAHSFGLKTYYDNRSTLYAEMAGIDNSKTIMVGAHADTLGLIVRRIEKNGTLRVTNLGGINFANIEGESVQIHTRNGKVYTGLICCQSHSTHVFDDARTLERNENTMMVTIDEDVKSEEDVRKLGIRHGDIISIDPRCQFTESGFLKSRFIDDKGAIASVFTALKYMKEHDLKPDYRTVFAFPYREEIGQGGTYVPEGVTEYTAMDIGLIGPDYDGNEYSVSICAKDNAGIYDWELTNRLIALAEKAECDYAVDVFHRYSTDANAAMRGGANIKNAAFGMAVISSHGMERCHIRGLENSVNLLLAYLMNTAE